MTAAVGERVVSPTLSPPAGRARIPRFLGVLVCRLTVIRKPVPLVKATVTNGRRGSLRIQGTDRAVGIRETKVPLARRAWGRNIHVADSSSAVSKTMEHVGLRSVSRLSARLLSPSE